MKLSSFIKNNKKLLLSIIIILLGITITITFAYFITEVKNNGTTDVTSSLGQTYTFIFDDGYPIELTMTQFNFSSDEEDGDLFSSTTSTATLTNVGGTTTTKMTYDVYFQISENTFEYSDTVNSTPELILTIKGPDGFITSLDGYDYVTSASGVSGFDVTEATGDIIISQNYEITATDETIDEWTVTLTIVNLDISQNDNLSKVFNCDLVLE